LGEFLVLFLTDHCRSPGHYQAHVSSNVRRRRLWSADQRCAEEPWWRNVYMCR